jgi:hypothetical protein
MQDSGETLNIKVVEESIALLKRGETQNFNIGRAKREGLTLEGFLSYDFKLESIFKFPLVFMVFFLIQHECMMSCKMSAPYVPHQKKKGCQI